VARHVYPWTVVAVKLHYQGATKRTSLVQGGHHHHRVGSNCSYNNIAVKQ
jgi:hypothetical protein